MASDHGSQWGLAYEAARWLSTIANWEDVHHTIYFFLLSISLAFNINFLHRKEQITDLWQQQHLAELLSVNRYGSGGYGACV